MFFFRNCLGNFFYVSVILNLKECYSKRLKLKKQLIITILFQAVLLTSHQCAVTTTGASSEKKTFVVVKKSSFLLPWKQMNDCLRSCWQFLFELIDEKLPVFRKVSAATFGLKLSKRQKACKKATIYLCGRNGNFWVFYCLKSNSEKSFKKKRMSCPHLSQKKKHEERMEELCWRMTWGNQAEKQPFVAVFRLFFWGPP